MWHYFFSFGHALALNDVCIYVYFCSTALALNDCMYICKSLQNFVNTKQSMPKKLDWWTPLLFFLTLKHRETHGCVFNTVAADALVLKHQTLSIHSVDKRFIVLEWYHTTILHSEWTTWASRIAFWKKWPSGLMVKRLLQIISAL